MIPSLTRRHALAGAAALAAPAILRFPPFATSARAQTPSGVDAGAGWTRQAYETAMQQSGRSASLSDGEFASIQQRRGAALRLIESYLKDRLGAADPAVMQAFRTIPREYFHYVYDAREPTPAEAYEANPKPWAIGYGSALSDYLGQAYMTQVCHPKPGQVTLEIGTGSGYQSAILSRIVAQAYSIEIISPLGHAVDRIWAPLGYDNVHGRVGDGYYGWPEIEGGFDVIIVTCAAQYAPPDLFKQLKPGGRLVIPIGQPFKRGQFLYIYTKDAQGKVHSRRDVGVFFIPMTGAMMKLPHPQAAKPILPVAETKPAAPAAPVPPAAPTSAAPTSAQPAPAQPAPAQPAQ